MKEDTGALMEREDLDSELSEEMSETVLPVSGELRKHDMHAIVLYSRVALQYVYMVLHE